ncbi:hypothetical protein THASP1DRAFT_31903 [Thamnocephalis sphaerospora]|uniref:F-box domain-containing protein n=1 Tax=Thamnocephalis sphaerospora TaxID=78915 RepID=A0A4P9XLQ1_9FUNG|nr:hypothetical protein THASP1DRAFT_31903 [Thamnocephalis sphaerospora]|eukprot:RKP06281.1 hypothetical protein THASP1DRAFT_31903 [Thamnocephalis sphaerospora]
MTPRRLTAGSAVAASRLPLEIWLLVALNADALSMLYLCATNRVFWRLLAKAQSLWRQLYYYMYPEAAVERFWLASYRARILEGVDAATTGMCMNWRRAVFARRQTEMNWRLGRYTQQFCLVEELQNTHSVWFDAEFTPYELQLRRFTPSVRYAVSVTNTNATHASPTHQLKDTPPDGQPDSRYATAVSNDDLLSTALRRRKHSSAWVHPQTGELAQKLAQNPEFNDELGSWVLFNQNPGVGVVAPPARWSLLAMSGERRPFHLEALDTFDYREYAFDPALDAEQDDMKSAADIRHDYKDACIMSACKNSVAVCAFNRSSTRLYWKVLEVTFDSQVGAGRSKVEHEGDATHGRVRVLRTGCCLDVWSGSRAADFVEVHLMSGGHVLVETRQNANIVVNVRNATGIFRPSRTFSDDGKSGSICTFQHGWAFDHAYRFCMELPHRRLLVVQYVSSWRDASPQTGIRLLRLHDGTVANSYSLSSLVTINHVLGDLVLLADYRDRDEDLRLFDVFAAVTIRTICTNVSASLRTVTPVQFFNNRGSRTARLANRGEDDGAGQTAQDGPSVRHFDWFDFMPDVAKHAKMFRTYAALT